VQNAPQQAPLNDLGISNDEELATLIRQGYSPEQARAMVSQPEMANSGMGAPQPGDVRTYSQPLAPTDTPNNLSARGYVYDGATDTWKRRRTEQVPAPVPQQGQANQNTPGYNTALAQEQALAEFRNQYGGIKFTDQATAPINDEMAGAVGYLSQGFGNLGRRLMGRDIEVSAGERGRAAMDVYRQQQQNYERENPIKAAVGGILGGFAFAPARVAGPVFGAVRGGQLFARPTAAQAYTGAGATGAAYGAADAEGGAGGRALGGITGGALGLATAGLIDGVGAGVSRLLRPASGATPGENRVASVLQRELRSNRITPDDVLSSLNSLPEGALPFNAQDNLLAPVAEALVASTGPGGRIVQGAVNAQRRAAPDRILSRISSEVGGEGNYFATLNNSIQTRQVAANQVINQIGPQQFRLNDNTIRALRSDLAQPQLRQAAQNALASPDQATYEMGANIMRLADTLRDNPAAATLDVRTAQDVSRALLDMSSDAWRRGDGTTGQAIGGIGRALRNNAREAVPEYNNWLKRYGDESSQIEALQLGRQVLGNPNDPRPDGVSAEVLRGQFAEMSDTAKDMFRKGIAEAIVARTAGRANGEINTMRDLLGVREYADRVRIAFPDEQAFTRFLNAAEVEVGLANAGQGITGNSRTIARAATLKRLGAQPEAEAVDQLSQATLTGIPLAIGRAGIRAAGRQMGRSRSVLENDQLNELLGRAVTEPELLRQMLMRQPRRGGLFSGRVPVGVAAAAPQAIPGF
jgi:hypothetical protein